MKWITERLRNELEPGAEGGGGASTDADPMSEGVRNAPDMGGDSESQPDAHSADGNQSLDAGKAWYESAGFSDDLLADEKARGMLGKYQGLDDFLKGAVNLNSKIGEKGVMPPGENATDSERAEFFNSIGRPEKADGYSWEPGEGFELDDAIYSEKTQRMHEAGLTDAQHAAVMDLYVEELQRLNTGLAEEQTQIAQESEMQLRKDWGNDYEENIKGARAAAEKFGVIDTLKASGLINDAGLIKMLSEVARSTRQDGIQLTGNFGSASEELESLKKSDAYKDKTHEDHAKTLKRAIELRGMV